jgi:hypothetical protein
MNYQDTIKYDENKRSYVDAFGYVVSSTASKHLIPIEETGVLKSTTDIVSNTNLENQVRLSTNNANLGIINTEGADTDIDLDLRTKGSLGSAFIKFNGDQSSYVSIGKGQATIRGNPTDLNLQPLGSGSKVRIANNSNNGGLEIVTDTPTNTGVTLQAASNQSTCNIIIQPKSGCYVSIPAPLYTTFGNMVRRHATDQTTNAGYEYIVNLDTAVENNFGSLVTWSSNRFTNVSGMTMKIIVTCTAGTNNSYSMDTDCSIKVFASGGGQRFTVGRMNQKWGNVSAPTISTSAQTFSSFASFSLANNEYFYWRVYTPSAMVLNGYGTDSTSCAQMTIMQVP